MILGAISGTVLHISDVINRSENFLPYKTIHISHIPKTEKQIKKSEEDKLLIEGVVEEELENGILTKEQADKFLENSNNYFQTTIVFFDYKVLDEFKVDDLVYILFDPYTEPLAENSTLTKTIMKVGLYITKSYLKFQIENVRKTMELIKEDEQIILEENREKIKKMFDS